MLNKLRRLDSNEHIFLSVIAVIIGLMVGTVSILFRNLILLFQWFFMGDASEQVVMALEGLPWWQILLMPVVGGLLVGPLLIFIFPGSRGHGVTEVMVSVALQGGRLGIKDGFGKVLACSLSIGCGGSVGREGPVIHLGATIASWFGQQLHMSTRHMRTMVGCGAAAGIAAAFNAPIAGVIFALEVILADYGLATFSPIVLSSVVSTVVARVHLGDFPAFIVPHYNLVSLWEMPMYVVLGLLCGVTGIVFMKTIFSVEDWVDKTRVPPYLRPALGGFVVGLIALAYPQVMGVGYDTMNVALLEQIAGITLLILIPAKIIATAVTLASGFNGGVFTPSLFLGAMVGGAFGTLTYSLFPAFSSGPGAYALVGMGAMVACVLGAPITSILILFELTGDYRIMVALMISSIVASLLVNQIYKDSVFTRALRRNNIDLWSGRESNLLRLLLVEQVMRTRCEMILETMSIRQFKEKLRESREENFLLVDQQGALQGIVSFQDIRGVAFDEGVEDLVLVRDIATRNPVTITPGENLLDALQRMNSANVEQLPVVAADNPNHVVGILTNNAVLRAYNKALLERETFRG